MNEERQWWIFTFGCGMKNAGHYVKFFGTFYEARSQMFEKFGDEWAFQYSEKEWSQALERAEKGGYSLETEMVLTEVDKDA